MGTSDVLVVGAGVFGSWCAALLARAGRRVLLLDAWGAGHTRSSSGDESRIMRMGYGSDVLYTRLAARSLALWRDLESRTGETLFHPTGVLRLAADDDAYSTASQAALTAAHLPYEILDVSELARRYPQFRFSGSGVYGILESSAGVLMARRAVQAVVRDARASGADYAIDSVRVSARGDVLSASGETITARSIVFACGPWLPKLFPDVLGALIRPTRQELLYFAPPAGDSLFAPPALPAWVDFTDPRGPYSVPDIESRGIKLGFDRHGPAFDPDTGDRQLAGETLEAARQFLAERMPALRDAPLAESRVCQYENTPNGDFVIDRHPEFPHIWIAGGGSGHGFKHGPAVGEYLCSRLLEDGPVEARFSLASKLQANRRSVY